MKGKIQEEREGGGRGSYIIIRKDSPCPDFTLVYNDYNINTNGIHNK